MASANHDRWRFCQNWQGWQLCAQSLVCRPVMYLSMSSAKSLNPARFLSSLIVLSFGCCPHLAFLKGSAIVIDAFFSLCQTMNQNERQTLPRSSRSPRRSLLGSAFWDLFPSYQFLCILQMCFRADRDFQQDLPSMTFGRLVRESTFACCRSFCSDLFHFRINTRPS